MQRKIGTVKAVSDVSLTIRRGETFGLVGESGCGKTTMGRMVVALETPTSGAVLFEDENIVGLSGRAMRRRRRDMQMMFQDPYASLDPRMRVGSILREPLNVQGIGTATSNASRCCGCSTRSACRHARPSCTRTSSPGGQRQRIGLARALALEPKLIVADEPVSALDVSIQAQILNLLKELQERHGLTYLFISHDLAIVKYMADRIGVMYLGKLVEIGPARDIYARTAHPYTQALIDTIPVADPTQQGPTGRAHPRRAAVAARPAVGLPVPHAVPLRPGRLRRGGASVAALRRGPPRRLPLPAADAHRARRRLELVPTAAGPA